jgi:hypothetical protein
VRLGTAFAALLCGALVLLPGCGSDSKGGTIPADQSARLNSAIDAADQYSAAGRCTRAHTKVRDARFLLTQLPSSVDADLRQNIADGLAHLDSLISSECEAPKQTQTNTTPTETTQTETKTETTPTETTPTETTPTETTLTTTTPTTTTPTDTTTTPTTTGTGGTPPGQAGGATGGTG